MTMRKAHSIDFMPRNLGSENVFHALLILTLSKSRIFEQLSLLISMTIKIK